ncbi:universal stress protein [Streptomyces sp. NPDC050315]|uniref:universal stress protein n=1 Tax=Streptomyces sp. NPDC050315 TaxID=3155039 RepID=UPI003449F2AA
MSGERVVVGVSGSLASLAALRAAVTEARHSGRELTAVIVWETPEGRALSVRHPDRIWAAHWARQARKRLDQAFEEALGGTPTDVPVRKLVVRGGPGRVLRDVAHKEGHLLVVGGRPRAWWAPVRQYVRWNVRCPLLTVPAPAHPKRAAWTLRRVGAEDFIKL